MASKLFQETQNNSLMNRVQDIKNNPQQYFLQSKMNIPPEYSKNPLDAINYLLKTGQINQAQVNQAMQLASGMGIQLR